MYFWILSWKHTCLKDYRFSTSVERVIIINLVLILSDVDSN